MVPTKIFHVRSDGTLYEPLAPKKRPLDIRRPSELQIETIPSESPTKPITQRFEDTEDAVFEPLNN